MIFRHGNPAVFINEIECYHETEGKYRTHILFMPVHSGTHIDLVGKTKKLSAERFSGQGMVVDVREITDRDMSVRDAETVKLPPETRFLFFYTGWDSHIDSAEYFDHPQLSLELVEWLGKRGLSMVGIDALGLGRGSNHGVYDGLLAGNDVLIIENLNNLRTLPARFVAVI